MYTPIILHEQLIEKISLIDIIYRFVLNSSIHLDKKIKKMIELRNLKITEKSHVNHNIVTATYRYSIFII